MLPLIYISGSIDLLAFDFMPKTVKTLSEIAAEYGIHINTLRRWIAPIKEDLKIQNRKLLLVWQIEMIYKFIEER